MTHKRWYAIKHQNHVDKTLYRETSDKKIC